MGTRCLHKHTVGDPLAQVKMHNVVAYLEEDWSLLAWQRRILTPLHNINRQNVKANKFILGRLGENQP